MTFHRATIMILAAVFLGGAVGLATIFPTELGKRVPGISVFSMGPAFAADSDKSPKKTRVVAKKQKPEV